MPDFDTRTRQEPNQPNRPRSLSIASRVRNLLIAMRLRTLLIGGGILLFVVVAIPVWLLNYGSLAQSTSQAAGCAGNGGTDRLQAGHDEVSDGKIAFVRENAATSNGDIYVIDENGNNETRLTNTARFEGAPVWSPDGGKIAFVALDGVKGDIYVMDADGTNQVRLAPSPEETRSSPAWSPDGDRMVFLSAPDYFEPYEYDIYVMDADGTEQTRLTYNSRGTSGAVTHTYSLVWSPDGKRIGFSSATFTYTEPDPDSSAEPASAPAEGLTGIYISSADGTGMCKLTSISDAYPEAARPTWSPDGNKIAFYDPSAIYLINDDGTGRKELTGNITDPPQHAWSPDGERIAFVNRFDLYVINADGSGMRRLTNTPGPEEEEASPTWSPDSEKIAFSCPFKAPAGSPGHGHTDLCVINADGTGLKRIASNAVAASWGKG